MTENLDMQLVEVYMYMLGLTCLDGRSKLVAKMRSGSARIINDHINGNDDGNNNDNDSNNNEPSDSWNCRGQGGLRRRSYNH